MQHPYPIGSLQSRFRGLIQALGSTIREQAQKLDRPHATIARRIEDPGELTLNELLAIIEKVNAAPDTGTKYSLQLKGSAKKR